MKTASALESARDSMKWWNRYYHSLLYLHYFLGILGILIGALIAADFSSSVSFLDNQVLGVVSTIIVGVVSFVQPGRMASAFYDAYWRMRVAILRHVEGQADVGKLVDAIENGFTAVGEIQPEPRDSVHEDDQSDLTDDQKAKLAAFRTALLAEGEPPDPAPGPDDTPPEPSK
ncbi:hypothetical protein ROLI_033120 [Roseobacter fucihabitans]|uniref:DUF4231 domain-containing protein n=1 Tax=Roseobacter fucihabitans TaxID=1537242 RepID=A0ABZ2BYE3_9RHOB|nr:hypothetical protein [Roseobacter litoralis]MBC6966730.1 hypothetical protein [Roseobacter litoralis]